MIKSLLIVCMIMFVTAIQTVATAQRSQKKDQIEVVGKVVAYDYVAPLHNLTVAPQKSIYIVQVIEWRKGDGNSEYIKVVDVSFKDSIDAEELFSKEKNWKFKLHRTCACDQTPLEMEGESTFSSQDSKLKVIRLKYLHKDVELDKKSKLPCYSVENIQAEI